MLNIGGLNEGIVLDHIHAGGAMEIYNYLNLEKLDCSVAIIKNAKSNKMANRRQICFRGLGYCFRNRSHQHLGIYLV